MIRSSGLPRYAWTFLLLAVIAVTAGRANEPTPPSAKPAGPVVVKPGAKPSKVPRPIKPTSFAVDVGTMAPGAKLSFDLTIRNTSTAPIRILGGTSGCSLKNGCNAVKGRYPLTIEPGETGKIELEYFAPKDATIKQARYDASFYVGAATTFAVPYQITARILPEPNQAEVAKRD